MFTLLKEQQERKEHYLYPGFLLVEEAPHIVTTVLGSCVSVCLWDPVTKIGGINHYMLPSWNGGGSPSFKYGDIAIRGLIEKMFKKGSKRNLTAKVFGGARMLQQSTPDYNPPAFAEGRLRGQDSSLEIGGKNIEIAEDILKDYGIPIISSDVGGNMGRKIIFHMHTGDVFVKKIRPRLLLSAQ